MSPASPLQETTSPASRPASAPSTSALSARTAPPPCGRRCSSTATPGTRSFPASAGRPPLLPGGRPRTGAAVTRWPATSTIDEAADAARGPHARAVDRDTRSTGWATPSGPCRFQAGDPAPASCAAWWPSARPPKPISPALRRQILLLRPLLRAVGPVGPVRAAVLDAMLTDASAADPASRRRRARQPRPARPTRACRRRSRSFILDRVDTTPRPSWTRTPGTHPGRRAEQGAGVEQPVLHV